MLNNSQEPQSPNNPNNPNNLNNLNNSSSSLNSSESTICIGDPKIFITNDIPSTPNEFCRLTVSSKESKKENIRAEGEKLGDREEEDIFLKSVFRENLDTSKVFDFDFFLSFLAFKILSNKKSKKYTDLSGKKEMGRFRRENCDRMDEVVLHSSPEINRKMGDKGN